MSQKRSEFTTELKIVNENTFFFVGQFGSVRASRARPFANYERTNRSDTHIAEAFLESHNVIRELDSRSLEALVSDARAVP